MQDYTSMTEMRIGILPGDPARYFQGPRSPQADCILEGGLLKAAALALLDPFRWGSRRMKVALDCLLSVGSPFKGVAIDPHACLDAWIESCLAEHV